MNEMPRMWSFEDGIYCAETDTFAYYENVREIFPVLANGISTYKFMDKHKVAPVYFIEDDVGMGDESVTALTFLYRDAAGRSCITWIFRTTPATDQGIIGLARAIDANGLPELEGFEMGELKED